MLDIYSWTITHIIMHLPLIRGLKKAITQRLGNVAKRTKGEQ